MATQFSGGTYVSTTFVGTLRSDIQANLLTQMVTAGWTNVAQAAGQGPGNVGPVTISVASPGVVSWSSSHGFLGGEKVILQIAAGGTMPTNLVVNTVYYVKYVDATTHRLAATLGGADINTTGSTSGQITLNAESVLLQSATQANVTNPVRLRIKDNRSTCTTISVENQAGTVNGANGTNNGGFLLPGVAKTFRIIASKYQVVCLVPGTNVAREFVMAGMLYVPPFLSGVTDHGYMLSNSLNDTDTTLRVNVRSSMQMTNYNNATSNLQILWNAGFLDWGNYGSSLAETPCLLFMWPYSPGGPGTVHYRWANDNLNTSDILLSCGMTYNAEAKIRGQFFDMIYIADAFAIDSTDTFNGHTWWNITNNNTGSPRGGFWVATS